MTAAKTTKTEVAKKTVKAEATETVRSRVFALLAKSKTGLTGAQIKEKLGLSGVPALLKDEGVCDKPRIRRTTSEDVRGVLYVLTALGLKAVKDGTVDENAAPPSGGKGWTK